MKIIQELNNLLNEKELVENKDVEKQLQMTFPNWVRYAVGKKPKDDLDDKFDQKKAAKAFVKTFVPHLRKKLNSLQREFGAGVKTRSCKEAEIFRYVIGKKSELSFFACMQAFGSKYYGFSIFGSIKGVEYSSPKLEKTKMSKLVKDLEKEVASYEKKVRQQNKAIK